MKDRMETIQPFRHLRRVYCAGPLFNHAERQEMECIADALRAQAFLEVLVKFPNELVILRRIIADGRSALKKRRDGIACGQGEHQAKREHSKFVVFELCIVWLVSQGRELSLEEQHYGRSDAPGYTECKRKNCYW